MLASVIPTPMSIPRVFVAAAPSSARASMTLAMPTPKGTLRRFKAVDAASRGEAYRASGWSTFDPAAPVYTPEQVARERAAYGPQV